MGGKSWFRKENERFVLAGLAALIAAVILLPRLGGFGFWDPYEITVADKATKLYERGGYIAFWRTELPMTGWAIATGVANLGKSEFAARLPLALLGLAGALATYALGARLRRPRAGLFAAIVLVSSPLFLFQSRQLTSDIGAVTGQAVAMLGLAGLAWPCASRRRGLVLLLDAVLVLVGLAMGLVSAGLFLGVLVPLAAAALAAAAFAGRRRDEDGAPPPQVRLFAVTSGVLALLVLAGIARLIFHFEAAQPGSLAIFGQMLVASPRYQPLVGGVWRVGEGPVTSAFDWIVNQVAFGMYPWSAVAPIAVLRLAFARGRDRFAWGGVFVLAWATLAYLACTLWIRVVGDVRYPALGAIALGIGFFLDDVMGARLEGDASRAPAATSGLPLAATFVFLAGIILALDLRNFPEQLSALPTLVTDTKAINVPGAIYWLVYAVLFFGAAFAAAAAIGLGVPGSDGRLFGLDRRVLIRAGLLGSLGIGGVFAFFLAVIYTPKLAEHYSQRNVFEAYFEHRQGNEPLGVMGISGTGPEYYARGRLERLDTHSQLLDFLGNAQERAFAIVPADRLCSIHQANTDRKIEYHVVDDRNSRFYLFSNKLAGDEKDVSPIVTSFHANLPSEIKRKIGAVFEDTVELVGVDIPDTVRKGETFKMTLWFKVMKRFNQSQQLLMHFDAQGAPVRFQADHYPKSCNTTFWQPGEIVSDTFDVVAGELTHPRGNYTVYTGFFTGGGGIWKNMTVTSGPHGTDNRVPLGNIRVE